MIHRNYAGGDLVLSTESGVVIKAMKIRCLAAKSAMTSSPPMGQRCWVLTTRPGSLRSWMRWLTVSHPEIEHGTIKVP